MLYHLKTVTKNKTKQKNPILLPSSPLLPPHSWNFSKMIKEKLVFLPVSRYWIRLFPPTSPPPALEYKIKLSLCLNLTQNLSSTTHTQS